MTDTISITTPARARGRLAFSDALRPRSTGIALTALMLAVPPALAGDLTVSDNRDTAATTAQGDGNGPGDIIIDGGGDITLTSGIPVTINSDNVFSSAGSVSTEQEQDAVGVLIDLNAEAEIDGGVATVGRISVPGPAEGSAIENQPVENAGVLVRGSGTFRGTIDNQQGGVIEVGGNASRGIAVDGNMIGNVFNSGTVSTPGIESAAISINGILDGNVTNAGSIGASGRDGVALFVGGSVSGTISNGGGMSVGRGIARDFDGTIIPEVRGGAGVWISGSVSGGFQNIGNRVTENDEFSLEAGDPALSVGDADISVVGAGQAIRVRPGGPGAAPSDIVMGAVGSGDNAFAILNQGIISTGTNDEGVNVEAVTISGLVSAGTVYRTTLTGGLRNDGGDIRTGTTDGTATGIRIGANATVPAISNSGEILAQTNDSEEDVNAGTIGNLGGDATAIIVETGATLTTIDNTGIIEANAAGSGSSAGAIIVQSGTLTSFSNTGDVLALIRDGSSGTSTALDVRTSTNDITFFNSGTITGDIYLGSGSDTVTVTGGTITGDFTLAGGNDDISISDATVLGSFLFSGGTKSATISNTTLNGGLVANGSVIDLTISGSDWTITAGEAAQLRTLDVQGATTLRIEVDGVNNRAGTISTTGAAVLSDETEIVPVLRSVITDQQRFTLLSAGDLSSDLTFDEASIASTSYMHRVSLVLDPDDPNVILLDVARRTADDLGLGTNTGIYYEASSTALGTDSPLFTSLASITDPAAFESALGQFMPDTSSAVMQAAINQHTMTLGTITRRLDRVPAQGFYKDRPTVWLQTGGGYVKQKGRGEEPGYTSWTGSVAIGTDRQVNSFTRAGIAYTQLWSFPDALNSVDKPTEYSSSQLNGYFRMGNSFKHLQGGVTLGYDSFNSERRVQFDGVSRTALADWNGYEAGANVQLALGWKRGGFSVIPAASLNYLFLHQGSWEETGGGGGLNLTADSDTRDSLRMGLGLGGRQDWNLEDDSLLQLEVRAGYTREFMTGTSSLDLAFAAGGNPFVLETAALTNDVLSLGAAVFYKNDHATVTIDYDGQKASGYTAHTGAITIRFRF